MLDTYVETNVERMCENLSEPTNLSSDNLNENNDENFETMKLTIKEAAQYIGESTGVIRNWMRELKPHIPAKQGENGYHYFDKVALERLQLIRKMSREQNYSLKQIHYHFSSGGKAIKPEPQIEASELILQELTSIKEQLDLQNQFNQALVQMLNDQQEYITQSLNKRDQQLLESIKASQQARIETAATKENVNEKKGFFGRMFSKRK